MFLKFILLIFIIHLKYILNVKSSRFFDESSEIRTAQINLNDPNHQSIIQNNFNLSADAIRRIRIHSEQKSVHESTAPNDENDRFKILKDDRKEVIRTKLFDIREKISPPEELTHEMAAYPSCNQNNETQWLHENNITVKFSASFFVRDEKNLYLDTAVLRLYKLNPHNTTSRTTRSAESNDCDQPPMDAQIRVTVSTIQAHRRNRRDRKKRICNTVMLNSSHRGWVEIDVKRAINIWDKFDKLTHDQNHNNTNDSKPVMVGWLTIEVHDEEERPLKPGLYFEPPKCSQAYPALPWNAYRIYYTTPADMEKVPKSPRLDVKLIDLRGLRSSTLKRSRSPLDFNAFDYINFDQSYTQTDCNQTHTHHHHGHHNVAEHEFNHHNNSVNPEDILYYADKKLNATAKKRIDEILFSTVSALAPYVSSGQLENSASTSSSVSSSTSSASSESKHHIKRHILTQQIQQHLQLQKQHNHQQQQQQQHHHDHHNHNRNNGRHHIRQKRQNFPNTKINKNFSNSIPGKNSLNNDDDIINNSTSVLMRKLRQ